MRSGTRKYNIILLLQLILIHNIVESSGPFSEETIQDWVQARCGGSGSAVWSYEGTLYDPLDGRKICGVEGIELVRILESSPSKSNRKSLLVSKDMKSSATILSRKLFCYQNPEKKLLTSIKLRPNSPKRSIPIDQSIALYDTATTVSTRRNGQDLILHTELPNRKCYWAIAEGGLATNDNDETNLKMPKSISFTAYTKGQAVDLPPSEENPITRDDNGKALVVSPKRPKLIQFGSPKTPGRFGARESYNYNYNYKNKNNNKKSPMRWRFWQKSPSLPKKDSPTCTVTYSRYGEGPPWYGPGRYCTLELKGRRLESVEHIKALPASIVAQLPGFLLVNRPISTDNDAKEAMALFREQRLQLSAKDKNARDKLKRQITTIWNKLTAASTNSVGVSSP